ncbi:MAG: FIST N-terminal domain-containing protein [Pseudomonadota bacterium]
MDIKLFQARGDDAPAEATRLAALAGARRPDLVVLFADEEAFEPARAAFLATTDGAALIAATSCRGVMSSGPEGAEAMGAFGALAFYDAAGAYGVGSAALDEADPRAAAAAAMRDAIENAGREGEAPALVWLASAPGCEEAVIAGLEDVVGASTPILGGSSADRAVQGRWAQATRERILANGVVVAALFPSTPISFAYSNGYAPTELSGVATKVDGRRLIEIDDRPAAEVYDGWCGAIGAPGDAPRAILAEATLRPLGRAVAATGDVPDYLLAHPATLHADGSLELFATVAPGERLRLMEGGVDPLTRRAGRVAQEALARESFAHERVAGALMVYCAGCMMAVDARMGDVAAGVREALAPIPMLGLYSFGEQGRCWGGGNRHGNLMISCVLFSK